MFKKNLFTYLTQFIVIILPFYVLIAVFVWVELWFKWIWFFIKEFVLVLLFLSLLYEFIKNKIKPSFDLVDYLIFWYIFYWIFITFFNWLWINSIIYWWRYDFLFFGVFLIFKHWKQFLEVSISELIKLFIISWSLSLLFSILIKFRLWEKALLELWFTEYRSNWIFDWWIPNYHWLENSWIKRFQWIFDWPNQMAFYIILYTSLILHSIKQKAEFYVIFLLSFLFMLLVITYSRSAMLWVIAWLWLLFLFNLKYIYKRYKKQFLYFSWAFLVFLIWFWFIFSDKIENIFLRESSTKWHFDRMEIWIDRFLEKPLWAWLAEAWPAYRSIYPEKQTKKDEQYYIPESWFVQQLIEWWIIYFLLFCSIFSIIVFKLYYISKAIFVWLIAILVMNVFLHIFEATYLTILLSLFIWLLISKKKEINLIKK